MSREELKNEIESATSAARIFHLQQFTMRTMELSREEWLAFEGLMSHKLASAFAGQYQPAYTAYCY